MQAKLLEGRPIAEKIKADISSEVKGIKTRRGISPKLVAVQIGENASSDVYVRNQRKAADALGIGYEIKMLSTGSSQSQAEALIRALNKDDSVSAVILQMPVPAGIDPKKIIALIDPAKDAEGMHPENLGRIILGNYTIGPCTAMAVMSLLESAGVDLYGKEAVIVGHSEIVGKPLSLMMLNKFATTTVCHIATGEKGILAEHVRKAEILVVAVGKAGLIKGEWVREGAIVIDVGINKSGDKIVGDVEFEEASRRASLITPVPGGVGPLTTTMLMKNTLEQFKARLKE